jgi:hypothetical protein
MTLHAALGAPEQGPDAIGRHVSGLFGIGNSEKFFDGSQQEDLQVSSPHPAYLAGAEEVKTGTLFLAAKLVSWRYLLFDIAGAPAGTGTLRAAAEVDSDGNLMSMSSGPVVEAFATGVSEAEELPQVKDGSYELRFLRITGLSVLALWLFDTGPQSEHMLIPLVPIQNLRIHEPCGGESFLRACQGAFKRRGPGVP